MALRLSPDLSEQARRTDARKNRHHRREALPNLSTSSASWRHSTHRQSPLIPHQDVSRCITRRSAALDIRRPPRWHPQCLFDCRSCRRRQGNSCPGIVQGIRGPDQSHQLSKLGGIECWIRRQQCRKRHDRKGGRTGWQSPRSVAPDEDQGQRTLDMGWGACARKSWPHG